MMSIRVLAMFRNMYAPQRQYWQLFYQMKKIVGNFSNKIKDLTNWKLQLLLNSGDQLPTIKNQDFV